MKDKTLPCEDIYFQNLTYASLAYSTENLYVP